MSLTKQADAYLDREYVSWLIKNVSMKNEFEKVYCLLCLLDSRFSHINLDAKFDELMLRQMSRL